MQSPSPAPQPQCANPWIAAHPIVPKVPDTPEEARLRGATGLAQIKVDLGADSRVLKVSVFKSSGAPDLDEAAMNAAKKSKFQTDVINCIAFPSSYIYRVEFQ